MLEKTCTKCGETKTVDKFRKDATRSDGYHSHCKVCRGKTESIRREKPEVKERQKEHVQKYMQKHGVRERSRERVKTWRQKVAEGYWKEYRSKPETKERARETRNAWARANRAARAAHHQVLQAVRRGAMVPARERKCFRCENQASEYHHHLGYKPENHLDVIPLCKSCHRLEHVD